MTKVLCISIILFLLTLGSCKKKNTEPDICNTAWTTQVQTQLTDLTNKATIYAATPTTANCNAFKAAYQAYIDALEPFGNCSIWTATEKAQWQNAIAEARADLTTACN
jgi:hypothetical protein